MSTTTAYSSLNYLALKNKHERDANISFEAGPHIYTINDGSQQNSKKNKYTSVTKWNHSHFAEFDADAIITTMMKGKGWSKSKYFGQTREEIKAGWEKGRDEAAALGTEMHYQIECYYNGGDPRQPPYTEVYPRQPPSQTPLQVMLIYQNQSHHLYMWHLHM